MKKFPHTLILADDDADDCLFFREALEEIPVSVQLTTVSDGVELMQLLTSFQGKLPDLLFLDLNMPRKTGLECLAEIKANETFRKLPVIIFSTSLDMTVVNQVYENGAQYYLRKPGNFNKLKKSIHKALSLNIPTTLQQPAKEQFIIEV